MQVDSTSDYDTKQELPLYKIIILTNSGFSISNVIGGIRHEKKEGTPLSTYIHIHLTSLPPLPLASY